MRETLVYLLDRATGCKVKWICDMHERMIRRA